MRIFRLLVLCALLLLPAGAAKAQHSAPQPPTSADKCAVCGMFVAKYPDWTAQLHWRDGSRNYFDGAKDLFKYLQDLSRYAPNKDRADITDIFVSEYYDLQPVPADSAFYVQGSDVLGPMGRELVPFATRADAEAFAKDHAGKQVLGFDEITPAVIKSLD